MKHLFWGLLAVLLLAIPSHAESWRYEIGPDLPGRFFSVGPHIDELGVPIGQYGGGKVVLIDPSTVDWRLWASLPVGAGHESVSVLQQIGAGIGINAWTESDAGAQCWTAWRDQNWRWKVLPGISTWR